MNRWCEGIEGGLKDLSGGFGTGSGSGRGSEVGVGLEKVVRVHTAFYGVQEEEQWEQLHYHGRFVLFYFSI